MSQQFNSSSRRICIRRLSGYLLAVLAVLLLSTGSPSAFASTACKVTYTINNQWSGGFGANISIQNTGTTAWSSWSLTWSFANGQTIPSGSLWNGNVSQSGANVTVTNMSYNGSITAGATYTGVGFNGTWNNSTNAIPTSFAVNGTVCGGSLTATTTTLSSSSTSTTTGTAVTLTAKVAPTAATGSVTFYDGTTSLGTGTLSSGTATLSTSFSTAGTHSITATYGGSTTYAASTSSAVSITVTTGSKTATTTTLSSSSTSVTTGTSVTLTAKVSPTAATGSVTFYDGTTSLGTGTLSSGTATLSTSFSTAGTHSITATYGGSTTYAASTSSAISITVTAPPLTSTTTTLSSSSTSTTTGTSVTLTAKVAPTAATGTVTFYDGTTSLGTGTLSSGTATLSTSFSTTGTHSITAAYGGSTTYAASTSSAVSITVTASSANAVVTVNPSNPGIAVNNTILGMNAAVWYDIAANQTAIVNAFQAAGIKAVRWPGGSISDLYHWSTNTECNGGYTVANDTFANFVNDIVTPAGLDVSLTANYGSNSACNGGGDPTEAASWAAQALSLKANVSHITVGNKVYGTWETDMHSVKNDPTTYANAVATGYYPDIKAASPERTGWRGCPAGLHAGIRPYSLMRSMTLSSSTTIQRRPDRKTTPPWCSRMHRV